MVSNLELIWTTEATKNLESILHYIGNEWGAKSVEKFKRKLRFRLKLISKIPTLFRKSYSNPELRLSVLNKQTTIIYKISERKIFIVYLFNNKQNPSYIK